MSPSHQEAARRELTRALALTIAYKAAVGDGARSAVVSAIGVAVENALESVHGFTATG